MIPQPARPSKPDRRAVGTDTPQDMNDLYKQTFLFFLFFFCSFSMVCFCVAVCAETSVSAMHMKKGIHELNAKYEASARKR